MTKNFRCFRKETKEVLKKMFGNEWEKLESINNHIILDYVWEDMEMMDTLRQWIKDTYED